MKFCMNCGCVVNEEQKSCNECGADIAEAAGKMQALMEKTAENEKNQMNPGITTQSEPVNTLNGLGMGMMGFSLFEGRYFSYSTYGMMFNSGYDLEVRESEGKLTAFYRGAMIARENAKQFEVDDAFFDMITEIIDKYNGDGWNGFNGRAEGVFDGDSFSFSFDDGKGRKISAGGYMMWPDGLGSAIREIKALFDAKPGEEENKRKEQTEKKEPGKPDKFCRNCGTKRSGTAKFCTECGYSFDQTLWTGSAEVSK